MIVRTEIPTIGTENVSRGRVERGTFRVPFRGAAASTDGAAGGDATGAGVGAGLIPGSGLGAGRGRRAVEGWRPARG